MAHDHHDTDSFAHPAPFKLLVGVFIALVALTILTLVLATVDLGALSPFGFWIAMFIATIKGALVMGVFMHMIWDKGSNVVVFLSSFPFVLLFIGMTLMDTGHYKENIDKFPREPEPEKPVASQPTDVEILRITKP